jgi:hypothetical protein
MVVPDTGTTRRLLLLICESLVGADDGKRLCVVRVYCMSRKLSEKPVHGFAMLRGAMTQEQLTAGVSTSM